MKRIPVPITFMVVLALITALLIFFGAWAVSADVKDQDRAFSFGFAVAGTISQASSADGTTPNARTNPDMALAEGSVGDSWWGQALIKACPLH